MKKILITVLLLLVACTKFGPDCVSIGDSYESVREKCGKPDRHAYRASTLYTAEYGKFQDDTYMIVMFDSMEKVNLVRFKSPERKVEKYE